MSLVALLYSSFMSLLYLPGLVSHHRVETAWFIAAFVLLGSLGVRSSRSGEPAVIEGLPIRAAVSLAVCIGFALALYFSSLSVGLLSDDFDLIERASTWQLSIGPHLLRPLPMFVWAVLTSVNESPIALHLVNVVVHGFNVWLLYGLAREYGLNTFAVAAAALFMTAPANVEVVTWISCLFDLLMVSGALLCLRGCVSEHKGLAMAGVAVALLSKETGVVAAPIAVIFALIGRRSIRIPLTALAVTIAFTAFRLMALPPPDYFRVAPSRHLFATMLSSAFGGIALPWSQTDLVNHPWLVQLPWLFLAALLGVVSWRGMGRRALLIALGSLIWVSLSVAPVYSFFFVSDLLAGSRYLYLGTAAFCLLLGTLAFEASRSVSKIIVLGTVAATTVSGVVGIGLHMGPWRAAGQRREVVLNAAKDTFAGSGCGTISADNLPDSEQGAYVFRNGFASALRLSGVIQYSSSSDIPCEYEWTGREFIRR